MKLISKFGRDDKRGRILGIECVIVAFMFLIPTAMLSSIAVDSDGDGWDDLYEKYIGTDQNNPDTDGDYIRDDEDPTPKGGLLNEDEIWDVFLVEMTPSSVLVDEGSQINISIIVEELLPRGVKLPVEKEMGNLKAYWGSYYGNLELVWNTSVTILNGMANSSYTPIKAGLYYFVLVLGDDTLGAQTSRYEMDWFKSKGKGGFCSVAVYPRYYAAVTEIYPYLLPKMNGTFELSFYEFSPTNDTDLTKHSTYVSLSKSAIEELYILSNGSVQIQVSYYGESTKYTIQVNGTTYWDKLFSKIGSYTITAYSFDAAFSWDYTFSAKFTFSRANVRVYDPEAIWYTINNTILFKSAKLTVHRYSLDANTMNASVFNQRYRECGSIQGILKKYLSSAIPWQGIVYLYALYTVYDHSQHQTKATVIKQESVSMTGFGTLSFQVTAPGSYRFACSFSTSINYPTTGKFSLYQDYRTKIMAYFNVASPIQLYLHTETTQIFTGDSVEAMFTFSDSSAVYNIQSYLDDTKEKLLVPTNGVAEHTFTSLNKGIHTIKGAIIFNTETANLLDLFGIENFYDDWLDNNRINVFDLAIAADPPRTLVRGIETQFRVIVQKNRDMPASDASVTVTLVDYYNSRNIVFTGSCDEDGVVIVSFFPPSNYYGDMEITATSPGKTETLDIDIYLRDQNYQGIITLNKPLYHPNDMILARFLVFNKDLMAPAEGYTEIRLRDPYQRDIYREKVVLDEYGSGNIEIPIGQKAPWGAYRVQVYYNEKEIGSVYFDVKEYKTPEIKLVLQDAEAMQGENITISTYVEYLFGQAVRNGEVNFSIEIQKERPYYYSWWWYDVVYSRCMTDTIEPGRARSYNSYDSTWSKETTVNVSDGWANVSLYVPYDADRIFIKARFSDDLEHEATDEKAYYIGKTPVEEAKTILTLTSSKHQWAVGDEPDISVNLFWEKEGKEHPLKNAEFSLKLEAINSKYISIGPMWYNGTTDDSGKWSGTLQDFGTSTQLLMEDDYYWLEITALAEAAEGGAVEASLSMPIYRYIYQVSTPNVYYARGEYVNIKLKQHDLLENEGIAGEAKLEIRPQYSNYYRSYYHRSYYGSDLVYSNTFLLDQSGELEFNWRVPLGLEPGLYYIKVICDNATISHTIQVLDYESNVLTLKAPNSYKGDQTLTVVGEFSKIYNGNILIDMFSANTANFSTLSLNNDEFTQDIQAPNTRATINLFVFYQDNGLYRSERISLSPEIPDLRLKLELERENYEPGETMNLTIKAFADGKLFNDNLMLALVITDQGVYELVQDNLADANQISSFTTPTWLDRGHYPYRNLKDILYIKKEGLSLVTEVRRVITKPSPYYGGGNNTWDIKYSSDADGIMDMDNDDELNSMTNVEEFERDSSLEAELETTEVRKFFTETAHFQPGLVINGKTVITFKLPDNIARWRIKALATSKDLLGCYTTGTFNVSKDFFVDLKLPYPLRQDDMVTFTVRVYNFAGKTLNVAVGIKKAEDWLQILDGAEKSITLSDGEVKDVKFLVNILGYDWQSMTAIGSDFSGHTDAMVKTVYIRPNGALKVIHYAGAVDGKETLKFSYDSETLNDSEKVTLRLSPGYSGLLLDGAGALCSYTYGCTEQTMSSLLPNILIWEYLSEKGKLTPAIRTWLSQYIVEGIQQLYSYQHYDGGWGWWKADEGDPWMTAYVLYGLSRANNVGFYVDSGTIQKAQNYLDDTMDENGTLQASSWMGGDNMVSTAYVAYSLAYSSSEYASKPIEALNSEYTSGNITDPYILAFYALALQENGNDNMAILKAISSMRTGSHWESDKALGGNDEATAWCVYALAYAEKGNYKEEIRGALEYLTALRRPWGGWATTSDTIASLHAILSVIETAGTVDMDVRVLINGDTFKKVHVDESYSSKQNFHSAMDAMDLTEIIKLSGENSIEIVTSGSGDLFYELTVVGYLRNEAVISIPDKINCTEQKEAFIEVKVDPKNSEAVSMVDAEVLIQDTDEITVLYVEETWPEQEDDVWTFRVYLIPNIHGTINITPVVVSYRLSAGFGESGIIRRYFGPIILEIEQSEVTKLNGSIQDIHGPFSSEVKIRKSISKNIAQIGDNINVTIEVIGLEDTSGLQIIDVLPTGFETVEDGTSQVVYDLKGENNITYSMVLQQPFNGQLPPAKLFYSGESVARSNAEVFATAGGGINVLRTYSKTNAQVGETVDVNIMVHSQEEVPYVVIEDYLPPSCIFDTTSLDSMSNADENIMEYSKTGNKVAIFIKSLGMTSLSYRFTVTDKVISPIDPTRAYEMYDPDNVGESSAKLFTSYHGETDESIDEWDITPGPSDDELDGDGPMPLPLKQEEDEKRDSGDWTVFFLDIAVIISIVAVIAFFIVQKKRRYENNKKNAVNGLKKKEERNQESKKELNKEPKKEG